MEGGEEMELVAESSGHLCPSAPPGPPVPWTDVLWRGCLRTSVTAAGPWVCEELLVLLHWFLEDCTDLRHRLLGVFVCARVLPCLLVHSGTGVPGEPHARCRVPCDHLPSVQFGSAGSVVECCVSVLNT